ncbi:MAG: universal stress protein, partial [Planctomycetota bacterium]
MAGTEYADAVVETAVSLAKRHQAPITAITAVDVRALRNVGPVPPGGGQAAKELREHRVKLTQESIEAAVRHFETRCREAEVDFQVEREEREDPYDFLASQS